MTLVSNTELAGEHNTGWAGSEYFFAGIFEHAGFFINAENTDGIRVLIGTVKTLPISRDGGKARGVSTAINPT